MTALKLGFGAEGFSLVKFSLVYDGELPSSGNGSKKTRRKWDIRKTFHPQLEELWRIHPALRRAESHRMVPKNGGFTIIETHHEHDENLGIPLHGELIDLCASIEKGGREFRPLVRKSHALTCSLKILFLRKEPAGRVYQGGDLDNRIKTLLDALSVPPYAEQVVSDPTVEDPIFCLVEDDGLITGISVETQRLLSRPNSSENEVRLIVEVDVRVTDSRAYNACFLGD